MAYKDSDKQREANRKAQAKFKAKGITKGKDEGITITTKGITKQDMEGITDRVLPEDVPAHGLTAGFENTVFVKPERTAEGNIKVSKPGDSDYVPQCETTRAFIEGRDKRLEAGKRGKAIKTFADLPPHVQETIEMMAMVEGKTDQSIKANRTAIAINYQHQFPDRYHSVGVAI